MRTLSGLALLSLAAPCLSQVALPSPAILPPPAASGAVPSTATKPNAQWSTLKGVASYHPPTAFPGATALDLTMAATLAKT
ncbi:hypothetical protein RSAG8_01560, partial [Rhizoctonia solani AG-8 WAC10335]